MSCMCKQRVYTWGLSLCLCSPISNIHLFVSFELFIYTLTCTFSLAHTQNSIRHNLSIRKNMFVKVYQLPPRRGNGSYWSLLVDGEAELKKAHPLFMTLLPPVIDEDCAYCRVPITHTVKSRGQFMPVLPQTTRKMPYFALNSSDFNNSIVQSSLSSVRQRCESDIATAATKLAKRHKHSSTMTAYSSTPKHLTEHSYAKAVTFEPEFQRVEVELAPEDMVEGSFVLNCESKQSYYGRGEGEEQGNSSTGTTNFQVCMYGYNGTSRTYM